MSTCILWFTVFACMGKDHSSCSDLYADVIMLIKIVLPL